MVTNSLDVRLVTAVAVCESVVKGKTMRGFGDAEVGFGDEGDAGIEGFLDEGAFVGHWVGMEGDGFLHLFFYY